MENGVCGYGSMCLLCNSKKCVFVVSYQVFGIPRDSVSFVDIFIFQNIDTIFILASNHLFMQNMKTFSFN